MKANRAGMVLGLALPQDRVSICLKDNHYVQNIKKTILDGSGL